MTLPKNRLNRRILATFVVLLSFLGLGLAGAQTSSAHDRVGAVAAASPPCYHDTCKGKNPETTGCANDATTLDSFSVDSFYVELRRSSNCGAVWTRIYTAKGAPITACNTNFGQIRSYYSNDKRKDVYGVQADCPGSGSTTSSRGSAYTKMLSFGDYVRACIGNWTDDDPYACTNRH